MESKDTTTNNGYYDNSFAVYFDFNVPESTKELRSDFASKSVYTENLLIMELSLVGNIGGTLGMLVGFSFIGLYEWILEALAKCSEISKTWRHRNKGK